MVSFIPCISGLKANFEGGMGNRLAKDEDKVAQLGGGVQTLVVGMVGWLSVMTVAAIVVFVIIYKRLSRHDDSDGGADAETGSVGGSTGDASSIIDFALFPSLNRDSLNTSLEDPGVSNLAVDIGQEDSPAVATPSGSDIPQVHSTPRDQSDC